MLMDIESSSCGLVMNVYDNFDISLSIRLRLPTNMGCNERASRWSVLADHTRHNVMNACILRRGQLFHTRMRSPLGASSGFLRALSLMIQYS